MKRRRTKRPRPTKLECAIALMIAASERLKQSKGRLARRNARRRMIGALKSARLQLDNEYPAIDKPAFTLKRAAELAASGKGGVLVRAAQFKLQAAAKRAAKKVVRLPFTRDFAKGGTLFGRILASIGDYEEPRFEFEHWGRNASTPAQNTAGALIRINPSWKERDKWIELINTYGWTAKNMDRYRQFHEGEMIDGLTDLGLMAEFREFVLKTHKREPTYPEPSKEALPA